MENHPSSTCLSPEPYTPPQVYSPLPIRTPVVTCVGLALNTFPNTNLAFDEREDVPIRKPKSNKFLLNRFIETQGLEQSEDSSEEGHGEGPRTLEERELKMLRKGICFVKLQRPPVRVSNPQINDETFLRENGNDGSLKIRFLKEKQSLTEQEA